MIEVSRADREAAVEALSLGLCQPTADRYVEVGELPDDASFVWENVEDVAMAIATAAEKARAEEREKLSRLADWADSYGSNLCPRSGMADSFGDGMRAAKNDVKSILLGERRR